VTARVGSAPDSWGVWFPSDPRQTPWHRFLDEVAEAGYEWIELGPYGYLPTDPARLRRELDQRGLRLIGGTVGGALPLHQPEARDRLREDVLQVGELTAALGGQALVLLPSSYRDPRTGARREPSTLDPADWGRLIETSHELGRAVAGRFGGELTLVFHPHADSHVETPEQVDAFLDQTDPALVSLCLDTGHYAYRGGDSVELVRRQHARIPYLHIKTVDGAQRRQVQEEDLPFGAAVARGVFCEPPNGVIDFEALARLLEAVGFDGPAVVEQDLYPCDFDTPLPVARRTRQYLRQIGLG
jgi:inosose dehydratase